MMGERCKRSGRTALRIAHLVYLHSLELMVLALMFQLWLLGLLVAIYFVWKPA